MIKKNLKLLIITSILVLLPIIAGVCMWDKLPAELPIHWNTEGEVDDWASKPLVVFVMPLILLAVHWLCAVVTSADPKKQNHNPKVYALIFWLVPLISTIVMTLTYVGSIGDGALSEKLIRVVIPATLGIIFVAIGNYLPKCKQNYTIGIKLPWTLHSEENWNKTHRMAGWLWVAGGILITATSFLGSLLLTLPVTLAMALIPTLYSYALHRRGV